MHLTAVKVLVVSALFALSRMFETSVTETGNHIKYVNRGRSLEK